MRLYSFSANSRIIDEFHFMCAALLLPNCRDAFLRLSQLPSLRDRRFIRQSCLLRRKNASLQVFTEFTYNRIVKRASKRSNKSSVETWRAASLSSGRAAPPLTRTEQTRECPSPAKRWTFFREGSPSPAKRWTFFREGSKNYSSSVILEDFFYLFLHGVSTERAFCWRSFLG